MLRTGTVNPVIFCKLCAIFKVHGRKKYGPNAKIKRSDPQTYFSDCCWYLTLLLAAAAGFDWQISQTIGNMNDPFATLFQDVGL